MAYIAPAIRLTGDLVTAAIWNADIVANEIAINAGAIALTSQAIGDLIIASTTSQLSRVADVATGQVLVSGGVGVAPAYSGSPSLSGTLTVGGTLGVTGAITSATSVALTGVTNNVGTITTGVWNAGAVTINGSSTMLNLTSSNTSSTMRFLNSAASGGYIEYSSDQFNFYTSTTVRVSISTAGLLTVSGFGTHSFSAGGAGFNAIQVANTTSGAAARAYALVTAGTVNAQLFAFSQGYTTGTWDKQAATALYADGAGGISIVAADASGTIRFYSGGSTERARLAANGEYYLGSSMTAVNSGLWTEHFSGATYYGMTLNETASTSGAGLISFNMAGTQKGSIGFNGTTGVNFQTTSDARLKMDMGVAITVDVLRRTVIHDFDWIADGSRARGVFAQEAYAVAPFAVSVGSDDMKDGHLVKPWSVDYSKYVPDLIVGWQQHDATITQLAARIAALESQDN